MVSFGSQGHHDYPARDPTAVAPGWLSPVLALEIPLPWRPAADRRGSARVDPADERGKSAGGAPRIHGELLKLGFEVAQSSVAKYMVKRCGPPSQGWHTFLRNHAPDIAAMSLFRCVGNSAVTKANPTERLVDSKGGARDARAALMGVPGPSSAAEMTALPSF